MRIAVTGGAGFIGSHIADAFLADGHRVLVVDDLSTGKRANVPDGAEFQQLDIRNADDVQQAFVAFGPEVVSHQAAQTSVSVSTREPSRDAHINVIGTLSVLQACTAQGVQRIVFASTGGAIYGEVPEGEKAEVGRPTAPLSPYACSKLAGEHYLRMWRHEYGLPFTILRYANVYGPRQDPHGEAGVVAIFSRRLQGGEPIRINAMRTRGDPGCIRDYVSVRDVVQANRFAADGRIAAAGIDILNVCTGRPATTADIARGLQAALGKQGELGFGPRRPGDLERSVLEQGPMVALLGEPEPLEEGLGRTARWFVDHPE